MQFVRPRVIAHMEREREPRLHQQPPHRRHAARQARLVRFCPACLLSGLKDYVQNRQSWFDEIIAVHEISDVPGLSEARDVAKALPAAPTPQRRHLPRVG